MNTVFVVLNGEKHEGGDVVSIHKSKEKAMVAAMAVRCCFPGGWNWEGDEPTDMYWENGCDFVMIKEIEIQE